MDRSFKFASYLLISRVYTRSLLQASVYGLTTTLAALFLSNRIGNWINILSRLNTYKVTLFIQKASIVISAILFHYLDSSEGAQNVLYAFIIVLGCTLKLSFIGNSIAIEKDWAMIISDGHLEQPLSTMRRIDLYILVSQLYLNVPGLGVRSPHNPTSSATGEEEASVPISIREDVQHRTFLATLALGMLYMNVLSFGGTMTAYLVLIGYNSGLLGIMKAVAGIMGVAGTYIMPLLAKRLGNIRTGLWSIWQLALTLALVVVALTNKLDYMAASRLGLWMFDIAENLILQEYTAPIHITSITGWQYSL
ncbi:hypothetical protein BGZ97_005499 [Linnemannia gamsii]|uniref:Solute carrier family 40 member n=1 Tax=Linnemannia gamsii TaxID=64522 RepID=A0A9P6QQF5_9FUNG|nr:hypothetical protein BGZ97_005499 [Linnemannia gamsii]